MGREQMVAFGVVAILVVLFLCFFCFCFCLLCCSGFKFWCFVLL